MPTLTIKCAYNAQAPSRILDLLQAVNVDEGETRLHNFSIRSDTSVLTQSGAERTLDVVPQDRLIARNPTDEMMSKFFVNLYRGKFETQVCSSVELTYTP